LEGLGDPWIGSGKNVVMEGFLPVTADPEIVQRIKLDPEVKVSEMWYC